MTPYKSPHYTGNPVDFSKGGRMIVSPSDLNIVWGRDNRYWKVPDQAQMPAELYQVSWLEVTGCVNNTNPTKNYEVGFELSLNPDAFGWSNSPVYIMIKRGKGGKFAWKKHSLTSFSGQSRFEISGILMKSNNSSKDSGDHQIYFGLYEVWSGKWKGGIKIHQISIKEF